jgi:hypothetical protein
MDEKNADVSKSELEELQKEVARLNAELEKQKVKERKPFPWRNLIAWILVVLATILAIAAPLASWGHDYLLDTNRFVNTVAPLIQDDAVAQAISDRAATRLVEGLDIQDRLDRVLPEEITFIAGPITNGVETLAQKAAKTILQSDQFYFVWERILTFAHSTAVEAIRGDGALEVTKQGDIVLDIDELLVELKTRLVDAGLTFLENVPVPSDVGMVVLFTADELGVARGGVHLLDTLNWLLPALAIIFFAAAVVISTNRRKFLMASGIGLALAMAIALISLNFAENQLLAQVKVESNLTAAQIVWDGVFSSLIGILWGVFALGVVVAAGAAVAGPYRWAVWLRTKTSHLFEAWQDRRRRGVKEPGPVGKFVEAHKMALRIGGLALVVFILLLLPEVSVGAVIGLGIALLVYLVIIELVRAPAPKETAEGTEEATAVPEEEKKEGARESKDETPAAQQAGEEEPPREE